MKYAKTWMLVAVLGSLDVIMTLYALRKGAIELNPIIRYLLQLMPNYLALTIVTLVCLCVGITAQRMIYEDYDYAPVLIFVTIWTVPVLWNSFQLIDGF